MKKVRFVCMMLIVSLIAQGQDTVTVMYYNILNYKADKLPYYRIITDYVRPDVVLLSEVSTDAGAVAIMDEMNEVGYCTYKKARFTKGPDKNNMLIYNGDKLVMKLQDSIPTELRLINRYLVYHKKTGTDTSFMDFYSAHLKSSSGTKNAMQRYRETKEFKNYLGTLAEVRNVFFWGDFNFYNFDKEPACKLLVDSGAVRFFDPISSLGNWHDNPTYAKIHTQSTRKRAFGGGATGGLDDRFDFIFTTPDVLDGTDGVRYIENSYISIGNDGERLNDSLTAIPLSRTVPEEVTYALYYSSDHLPVVMKLIVEIDSESNVENLTERNLGPLVDVEVYNMSGVLLYKGELKNAPQFYIQAIIVRYNHEYGSVVKKSIGLPKF